MSCKKNVVIKKQIITKWSVRLIEILSCMQVFQLFTEFSLEIYQTAKKKCHLVFCCRDFISNKSF